jgi:hypothetical protein
MQAVPSGAAAEPCLVYRLCLQLVLVVQNCCMLSGAGRVRVCVCGVGWGGRREGSSLRCARIMSSQLATVLKA